MANKTKATEEVETPIERIEEDVNSNAVKWFPVFLEKTISEIKNIEHPETVSENLPKILDVLEVVKAAPYQKVEHSFSSLSRTIMAARQEKAELEARNKELERDNERFTQSNAELVEGIKVAKKKLAESHDEAESIYQERLESLKEYEKSISDKDEAANRKLETAERLNREARNIKNDADRNLAEISKKRAENENYLKVIASQNISLTKKSETLDLSQKKAAEWEAKLAKNRQEIEGKVQELDAKKRELIRKEEEVLKSFHAARAKLAVLQNEEQSIKKRALDSQLKLKQAEKTIADSNSVIRSAQIISDRLEKKYGIKGVVDFAKEKGIILQESVNLKEASKAYQIMVREAKKRGWSDREVDIPVFQVIGDNEFVKKLRETA